MLEASSLDSRTDGRTLRVKLSADMKDGSSLRFEGLGAPDVRNRGCFGDLYVVLHAKKRD